MRWTVISGLAAMKDFKASSIAALVSLLSQVITVTAAFPEVWGSWAEELPLDEELVEGGADEQAAARKLKAIRRLANRENFLDILYSF